MILTVGCCAGCAHATNQSWHEKFNWQAEDYFEAPQVIALCKAIEANDLDEMERLIQAGADVNAKGEGNMTPLLWAYFDNNLARFKLLLERGADPNVYVTSDLGSPRVVAAGDTVTHMASGTSFPGYFEAVFNNGGDPNLMSKTKLLGKDETPIFRVLRGPAAEKKAKVEMLARLGADLDHLSYSKTPAMTAVARGRYDLALLLLELGADHRTYRSRSNSRLMHTVVMPEYASVPVALDHPDRHRLLKWLEDHGDSADEARADIERWRSWPIYNGDYARKMEAEVIKRKRREARERQAAEKKAVEQMKKAKAEEAAVDESTDN